MSYIETQKSEPNDTPQVAILPKERSSLGLATDSKGQGIFLGADMRPAAEKALVRKLDIRLMPVVTIIFIMNYIDVSFAIASLSHIKSPG